MKKLIIVESPAKIKTISKFLGKDYQLMSTVGHVKDLPTREIGVHMNKGITIDYVVLDKKEKIINDIVKAGAKVDTIFLAPDPDREGEIIAWHVAQELKSRLKKAKKKPEIYRIAFNEITKPAVEEALSHPTTIDLDKVAAQQARRVLDRWVGYEVSPILWRKVSKGLSAGRVQSVALRLICEREEAIRTFKPKEYWSITGTFATPKGKFNAPFVQKNKKKIEIKNKKESDTLVKDMKKQAYTVSAIKDSKRLKNPAAPFMTSTLQQSAYNQLGFSVDKTMSLAQKLYEGVPLNDAGTPVALITYMRTDSMRLSDTALKQARTYIKKEYGTDYLPSKANVYAKGKAKAQDAHEAVRPIDVKRDPSEIVRYLDKDLARLYTLIWQRFVASQMKPAQYAQRQVSVEGGPYLFKVTGSTLLFDGFLKVYNTDADEEKDKAKDKKVVLPADLKVKMAVDLAKLAPKQHFTEPPPRYTQASLVKELEKEGIGRPSTYAAIMRTIQARAYTELDKKKKFIPTELGMHVTKLLTEHLPKVMDVKFTATMEEDLDAIAKGDASRDAILKAFYKDFEKDVEAFAGKEGKAAQLTDIKCKECKKGKLAIRFGKAGSFLGCNTFPDCTFTSNFTREEDGTITLKKTEGPKLLKEKCPKCKKQLRQVVGRYGPFIACSGYPACKYIHQIAAKFKCPECKKKVHKKSWKGKTFWGCSGYPDCKFSISGEIEETKCPTCKNPYLLKRTSPEKDTILICGNKACDYKVTVSDEDVN